jgi:hypothetical protein
LNSDELELLLNQQGESIELDDNLVKYNKILQTTIKNPKVPINIKANLPSLSITKVGDILSLNSTNPKIKFKQPDIDFLNVLFKNLIGGEHNLKANIEEIKQLDLVEKKPKVEPQADQIQFESKDQFYKIYGKRPKNVPDTIPVITEPIQSPKKSNVDNDAEDGIHDLFDL